MRFLHRKPSGEIDLNLTHVTDKIMQDKVSRYVHSLMHGESCTCILRIFPFFKAASI